MDMFGWVEYAVFGSMLGLSTVVGLYYGCLKRADNSVTEYFLGGKSMGAVPVAISLMASHVSGITLVGVPAEVYVYGTQYYAISFSTLIAMVFSIVFIVPLFYPLQLNSFFKYLELRFNQSVRLLASFIYILGLVLHMAVVIYVPSIAFSQVSGVPVHTATSAVALICVLYTTIGGLRAVVWTDAIQTGFMMVSLAVIIVRGLSFAGGLSRVLEVSTQGHRLELFNLDVDPTLRQTFWSMVLGCSFTLLPHFSFSPGTLQRCIAVPTQKAAKRVIIWSSIGFIAVNTLSQLIGLILYTTYSGCDPISTRKVSHSGQIVSLFVMELSADLPFPGFSGLFIAGVFSAALSTMSAGLNTAAGTIYEDFVLPFHSSHSDAKGAWIVKLLTLVLGIVSVLLVFLVSNIGGVVQLALSLLGVTHGAILFLFVFGMFFPWATSKGALAGAATSLVAMLYFVTSAQMAISQGHIKYPGKALSVLACSNITKPDLTQYLPVSEYQGVGSPTVSDGDTPYIFQLSYHYYNLVGTLLGFLVGLPVSIMTGRADLHDLDPNLLVPLVRRLLPAPRKSSWIAMFSSTTTKEKEQFETG